MTRATTGKLRVGLAGLALAVLVAPAAATAAVRVKGIDTSHYPTIRATVISSAGPAIQPALREGGTPVAGFQARNLASEKSVVLAIDRSRSMRGASFADAIRAASEFVSAKAPNDEVSVVAFASNVVGMSRFSVDPGAASSALESMHIDSRQGTSLYDAVNFASLQLSRRDTGRVLILLTDGTDTDSRHTLQGVADAARARNVLVYPIAIAGPSYNPNPLTALARETGGTFYRAESSSALSNVYASIARALRNTWRVEYLTTARPGDAIRLDAAVAGAGTASGQANIPRSFGMAQSPDGSHVVPRGAYGPSGPIAIGILVSVIVFLAIVLVLAGMRGSWVQSRIAAHVGGARGSTKQQRRERRLAAVNTLFRATERAFGHMKQWRWTQRVLERADVPLKTVEFFWIVIGGAFFLALFGAVTAQSAIVILLLMAIGGAGPFIFVWVKMRRRLRAFENQLPDLLVTIAASLKAGHSFKQGLQAVVDEGQPPASDEFNRVLTETSLGRPMDEALAEMAARAGSANFEFAITAVTIQRQVGGSLASLFDMVADTVRQRQQFSRKIRSLTAMGRMSAYVLIGIPFFMASTITMINPSYMHPLYHTHAGHLMVIVGLMMMAVGSTILRKIVSFRG